MTNSLNSKKSNFLIFLCWAAYTFAYVGRLNYNASMVEILSQLDITKQAAGTVSSFFFFAYGAGQLINGLLVKRYNTRLSVTVALVMSSVINLAMTFCGGIAAMKYLWLLNGIFQSILWSSLIKTISDNLEDNRLSRAVMVMSTTVASGTFIAYGLAALFSYFALSWTVIFYVASALTGAVAVLWFVGMGALISKKTESETVKVTGRGELKITPSVLIGASVILVCAITNGFIKDGITTWVPSVLKEEFGVTASLSIIITLVLPVLSIFGTYLVNLLHKKEKDENALNGIFYFAALVFSALIIYTLKLKSVPLTLGFFGITACLMSAVNNVITSVVPLYSRNKIDSGLLAGILNTFCYIGSTLSTSLLGKIADTKGWNDVMICIFIFTAVSFTACLISVFIKRKRVRFGA